MYAAAPNGPERLDRRDERRPTNDVVEFTFVYKAVRAFWNGVRALCLNLRPPREVLGDVLDGLQTANA